MNRLYRSPKLLLQRKFKVYFMWIYYFRLAFVSLIKTPILSLLMVLAVAIGIAACLVTFTLYSVMSSNPMAHKNEYLKAVQLDSWGDPYRGRNQVPPQLSYQDSSALFEAFTSDEQLAEKMVLSYKAKMVVRHPDTRDDASIQIARVTTKDFFEMFDVSFVYGQRWGKEEDKVPTKVVIINEKINSIYFSGKNSVGKIFLVDGKPYTIVGVVSDSWQIIPKVYDLNNGPFVQSEELYIPFSNAREEEIRTFGNQDGWNSSVKINTRQEFYDLAESVWIQVWVELISEKQEALFSRYLESYITQEKTKGRYLRPLLYVLSSPEEWLKINKAVPNDNKILVGLSVVFLLVCLVNTITLLLAKFQRKSNEAGVRRALGASRVAIFSQHLIEALVIAMLGTAIGFILSSLGLAGVRSMYGDYEQIAQINTITFFLAFTLAFLSSLVSGALPAWRISRTAPALYLKLQ